ncbi:hypothetical protein At15955_52080 (plasmid) [Agrobacterium tumefaciens]|nr:ethanolamine ammonia-lyase light chain [Agrobacterium tumefaciens LBA4213 (Ach5)]AKC10810.1 ethanolamine ammonia-lyase small subunit [Agrobacterium tumefaciens]AYM20193.1 hypothetical protein At15955_52080 [Agrobacterium tumefaciens]AYM71496.1 hypothetical protein AtA6_52800 [Agrobacterium tumefaciens]CUX05193.1 putative Ethanolamine ammonia-lyase [Agrobacterium fabacearum TT111]
MEEVREPTAAGKNLTIKDMTDARVSLGRHGAGLPTRAQLAFLLDHARAREAVWTSVDRPSLADRLDRLGLPAVNVDSMASDRSTYVRRPDLGRRLAAESEKRLKHERTINGYDVAIIVADGLSSHAIDLNAVPLIEALVPKLAILNLTAAPIVLASQARVALGDPAGEALGAKLTIVLVGERPGLSAADSLGAQVGKPGFQPKLCLQYQGWWSAGLRSCRDHCDADQGYDEDPRQWRGAQGCHGGVSRKT